MADRIFTPDEANAALRRLRPVAERMVALERRRRAAAERRSDLHERIAGNGGGHAAADAARAEAELLRLGEAVGACVDEIAAAGVEVKDLELGLLDFPALRDGREILLCWRVGEDEIAWWHGPEEGFAGRKPLDAVE